MTGSRSGTLIGPTGVYRLLECDRLPADLMALVRSGDAAGGLRRHRGRHRNRVMELSHPFVSAARRVKPQNARD